MILADFYFFNFICRYYLSDLIEQLKTSFFTLVAQNHSKFSFRLYRYQYKNFLEIIELFFLLSCPFIFPNWVSQYNFIFTHILLTHSMTLLLSLKNDLWTEFVKAIFFWILSDFGWAFGFLLKYPMLIIWVGDRYTSFLVYFTTEQHEPKKQPPSSLILLVSKSFLNVYLSDR